MRQYPVQSPSQKLAQHNTTAKQQSVVATAVIAPAVVKRQPDAPNSAAVQGTVRAVPLPALRLEHFQTADVSASAVSADAVSLSAAASTDLTNFDHAAYAEFQSLFDVPAGRSAPYLLPPEKGRSHSQDRPAVERC